MIQGWIRIHRQLQENKIWVDKPFAKGQAWIDLIILASWKDNKFFKRGLEIDQPEGTVAVSMKGLATRWGWSIGKVKRFLLYLENENQIRNQIDNVTTLIHITNWKEYQGTETKKKRKRKPDGNQTETIEEGKEGKEEKIDDFSRFYSAYPKKKGKDKAEAAFSKLNGDIPGIEDLLTILEKHKKSPEWAKDGGQFIPHPSTWLNQKRWQDEIETTKSNSNTDLFGRTPHC